MRSKYLIFLILLVVSGTLFGQTATTVNDPYVYGGTCTNFQNYLGGKQPTAVWIDQDLILSDIPVAASIAGEFEIYLGAPGDSTQGLAVSLQQLGDDAIGSGGQAMGYGTTGVPSLPVITFEIDTNPGIHDSLTGSSHHLALHLNGEYDQVPVSYLPLPDMLDGHFHHVVLTINWDPINTANQYVSLSINGTHTITHYMEFSTVFSLSDEVFIGGTSAPVGTNPNPVFASQGAPGDPGTCSVTSFPIELLSFEGKATPSGQVRLLWETAMEQNFSHFSIERSIDQNLWMPAGRVNGFGNSEQVRAYEFTDRVNGSGTYYYRLKQVDIDGSYEYSRILSVKIEGSSMHLKPNPASEFIQLDLGSISDEFSYVDIEILDVQGRAVYQERAITSETSLKEIPIHGLLPGMYLVKVAGNTRIVWAERLMVK